MAFELHSLRRYDPDQVTKGVVSAAVAAPLWFVLWYKVSLEVNATKDKKQIVRSFHSEILFKKALNVRECGEGAAKGKIMPECDIPNEKCMRYTIEF